MAENVGLAHAAFKKCVLECAKTPEFVASFDRLNSTNLSMKGSALDLMIDKASGRLNAELKLFCDFVAEYVWKPLQLSGAS